MTRDLENRLHRALQPIDPGDEFAQRVMQQVDAGKPRRMAWISAALAASIVMAGVAVHQWQRREKAEGLAARAQVLEALRVATDKLDLASRLVNTT